MKKSTNITALFAEIIELEIQNTPTQLDSSELETVTGAPVVENDPIPT